MNIKIYDIDGTLTKVKGDNDTPDAFETYAFWPLLTYHFANNPKQLKTEVDAWETSDKGTGEAFIQSSLNMLQRGIAFFDTTITGHDLQARAKNISLQFIDQNILRLDSIQHLKAALEAEELCILSTGSYTDGAIGFVEALIERNLLPKNALERLIISGAIVDWHTRTIIHANIADNKLKVLFETCRQKTVEFNPDHITGIYVDDPLGNDSGLCALKPDHVHLIRTVKNQSLHFDGLRHETWAEIIDSNTHYTPEPIQPKS